MLYGIEFWHPIILEDTELLCENCFWSVWKCSFDSLLYRGEVIIKIKISGKFFYFHKETFCLLYVTTFSNQNCSYLWVIKEHLWVELDSNLNFEQVIYCSLVKILSEIIDMWNIFLKESTDHLSLAFTKMQPQYALSFHLSLLKEIASCRQFL